MTERPGHRCVRYLAKLLLVASWLWCVLALYYFPVGPRWLGALMTVAFAIWAVWLTRPQPVTRRMLGYYYAVVAVVVVVCALIPPTHNRRWSRAQAVMPRAEFRSDTLRIRNIRKTVYRTNDEYEVQHYDQDFDLDELESVWFGVQHFAAWKGLAHTFVSFGFRDGEYLGISVEARRPEGEGFSPVAGLFKQFGLIYVVGSEQDVIGPRAAFREDPIYLYPIKANDEQRRAMLRAMLERANQLAEEPEFYNTLTNNCTTNIVERFNEIAPIRISPYQFDVIFPGYSGDLAYAQGLIETSESFADVKSRAQINEAARAAAVSSDFSRRIRVRYPGVTGTSE